MSVMKPILTGPESVCANALKVPSRDGQCCNEGLEFHG